MKTRLHTPGLELCLLAWIGISGHAAAGPARPPVPALQPTRPVDRAPTSRATTYTVSAGVVINEVAADAKDGGADWLELFNASIEGVDISGWSLTDSDGAGGPNPTHLFTFPTGTTLAPGQYLVLEEGAPGSFAFGLGKVDGLFLYDVAGAEVDSTTWADGQAPAGGSWGRLTNGLGGFVTLTDVTRGEMNRNDEVNGDGPAYVFDPTEVREYNLLLREDLLAQLNADPMAEAYFPGYIETEGQLRGPVGLRYKGEFDLYACVDETGAPECPKMPWKVSFHEYDESGRYLGLRKLQLHNLRNDDTYVHERLAHSLFAQMGVPTSRAVYARVSLNGEYLGLYLVVEQVDGVFTEGHFEDGGEGNLYKEVWPQFTSGDPYFAALETNGDENPDVSQMTQFATDLMRTPPADLLPILDSHLDLPQMMNYLAVDRGINNWDGIMGWYCSKGVCFPHNFYWYEAVDRSMMWLIPSDLDYTFATYYITPFWTPWYDPSLLCIQHYFYYYQSPACDELIYGLSRLMWAEYGEAAQRFLDGPYSQAAVQAELALYLEQIEPHLADEPEPLSIEEWQVALDLLYADIETLRQRLRDEIALPAPPLE